ncbi:MAG: TraB/GumN family protein [Spirochaetota bacterium]
MELTTAPKIEKESESLHIIHYPDGKTLYLVGTAHVSKESVELVEETINRVNPDTLCVELDDKRFERMTNKEKFLDINIVEILKNKQMFYFIGQFILAMFQRKIAEKTGSTPGREFTRAIELAKERDIRIVLAERDIGVTLKRAWRLNRFRDKFKLIAGLGASESVDIENMDIEELKSFDVMSKIMEEFAEELPVTKRVLIDERDIYLAEKIREGLGQTTVAVVGAGHVPGMLEILESNSQPADLSEIEYVPPAAPVGKILKWGIPIIIISIFIWGFFSGGRDVAGEVLLYWVLINGILTAIGCLLSFAHPLTTISGFIAAPITSLNPTIGAGIVTGIVQAMLVKPRVRDFEELRDSTMRIRGWWTNRVTRVFLVFFFSSLGSAIGTFVAFPFLTKFFTG